MKLRHIDQCIGAIPPIVLSPGGSVFELYDRFNYLRGYLWSGRRQKFEESVDRLLELLDRADRPSMGLGTPPFLTVPIHIRQRSAEPNRVVEKTSLKTACYRRPKSSVTVTTEIR
jgi:hypothetical protein